MAEYEKVERGGKVAVLYSPGFGAGWYSWNADHEGLLFDAEIVAAVEAGDKAKAAAIATHKYGEDVYVGGADDLKIEWLPKGECFVIEEYDGSESIQRKGSTDWKVA